MLKIYEYGGLTYQFEEGEQPIGAVEVKKAEEVEVKKAEAKNKAKKPANKSKKAAAK